MPILKIFAHRIMFLSHYATFLTTSCSHNFEDYVRSILTCGAKPIFPLAVFFLSGSSLFHPFLCHFSDLEFYQIFLPSFRFNISHISFSTRIFSPTFPTFLSFSRLTIFSPTSVFSICFQLEFFTPIFGIKIFSHKINFSD